MSLINIITNTEETVASGGSIPLTTITRRTGCALNLNSNSVVISKPGYYILDANVTFEAQAEGTETISVYKNGVLIPGATITLAATGGEITIQNANVRLLNA